MSANMRCSFDRSVATGQPDPDVSGMLIMLVAFCLAAVVLLSGCSGQQARPVLNAAPPAPVVAKVAIPVACIVEQVPMPAYPGDLAQDGDDIYTLARLTMADRRVRIAERDRLRAANATPCPGAPVDPRQP